MPPAHEITLQILDTTKPDVGARKGPSFTYPRWSLETKPYWDGCMRGDLLYQQCRDCGEVVFHPRALCSHCLGSNLDWRQSAGRGKVYSFTAQHIPLHRERPGKLPRYLGIVELDEGYHMFTELVMGTGAEPRIDMPVAVFFDQVAEDLTLPKFKPV
jgi:uncharacterized OB-fold protein